MNMIFMYKKYYFKMGMAIVAGLMSIIFFLSRWMKIPHGGYWSLIIASVPLFIIILYTQGQKRLYASLPPMDKDVFLEEYCKRSCRRYSSLFYPQMGQYILKNLFVDQRVVAEFCQFL
jgi:K+ transporter